MVHRGSAEEFNVCNKQVQSVLDFWFAETGAGSPTAKDSKRWFGGGESLDQEIEQKFAHLLDQSLLSWLETPESCLAYIVLHDQFPLNIFRRQAKAFAFESKAEHATQVALQKGFDQSRGYGERVFMYMPLMHSESLALQNLGVNMFARLADDVPEALREAAQGNLKYAQEHRDTIAKFGRFPFRNQVLGRNNTEQEQVFLESGAPRYGQ